MALLLLAVACKTKQTAPSTTAGPVTDPGIVNEKLLQVAQSKYAGATLASLQSGHDLYFGTCTRCHGAKPISRFELGRWPSIIDDMARKAKISDQEKQDVLQYVVSVKLNEKQ